MQMTIRAATKRDCHDLWLWRNHPAIRKWCFDTHRISYGLHRKWFDKQIDDRNVRIYIACAKNAEKLGVVRFEIDKGQKRARINVNLNPYFFGKGLGHRIIKIATKVFLKEKQGIKKIFAEIIRDNIASEKAFKKAGYLLRTQGREA